jgi:hypothetical protein
MVFAQPGVTREIRAVERINLVEVPPAPVSTRLIHAEHQAGTGPLAPCECEERAKSVENETPVASIE